MRMYDIISKKRHAEELSDDEIQYFIEGYTNGSIPDYQASAFTMAVCFNGMSEHETFVMTNAMAHSGDTVDLSEFGDKTVDKHSTGGVGDKTTLIVAPIVASLGAKVTKMSGRGLGHTGGTVDKLESIPGYNISLASNEFTKQINNVGVAVVGQSGNLTPADKKLYALRDVTATVDSIPLIVSSVMSKKLAAGSKTIVLDVKCGSGAFMKTPEDAQVLAEQMVKIGKLSGRNMAALITNMNMPLGNSIGNSLEVIEAVSVLKGGSNGDLRTICVALASNMISLVNNISIEKAEELVVDSIDSGKAYEKMKEWIAAQGGDISYLDDVSKFEKSSYEYKVCSESKGYISFIDAEKIGNVSVLLGAGRQTKDDDIDYSAGIVMDKNFGDCVDKGDVLCTLYTNNECVLNEAKQACIKAITISEKKPDEMPLIYKTVR